VVSDDQYIVALANRDTPPQLVDTSLVRIRSGDLTAEEVKAASQGPDGTAFLFATHRLSHLPGLESWVQGRSRSRDRLDVNRTLYLP
jgi:hypothetical protein